MNGVLFQLCDPGSSAVRAVKEAAKEAALAGVVGITATTAVKRR